jgi:hypothetical protein
MYVISQNLSEVLVEKRVAVTECLTHEARRVVKKDGFSVRPNVLTLWSIGCDQLLIDASQERGNIGGIITVP